MLRNPKFTNHRLRGWWWGSGVILFPVLALTAPLWMSLFIPWRRAGFPSGVGRIGGLPKTRIGRIYAASIDLRVGLWFVFFCITQVALMLTFPSLPGAFSHTTRTGNFHTQTVLFIVGMTIPYALGWWWHLERTLGQRRLQAFLDNTHADVTYAPTPTDEAPPDVLTADAYWLSVASGGRKSR